LNQTVKYELVDIHGKNGFAEV